jgi:transposase, IS6 family
VDHVTIYR